MAGPVPRLLGPSLGPSPMGNSLELDRAQFANCCSRLCSLASSEVFFLTSDQREGCAFGGEGVGEH